MKKTNTLVCIPCYNCDDTIEVMLQSVLANSDADLLLVDDHSDVPLASYIPDRFPDDVQRIQIIRPKDKIFAGGARNLGIWKAIDEDYSFLVLMDSDLQLPDRLISGFRDYFRRYPNQVLVAPSIEPAGNRWQNADTLINFSTYLPAPGNSVTPKTCLAGYAFALNIRLYRERPCFHHNRYGGEDVIYFTDVMDRFELDALPMLNGLSVRHLPPRRSSTDARKAQQRYGSAFFSHNEGVRERYFTANPWLHYLTPRFVLLILRLLRRRRFSDLMYAPLCWYLDLARARTIVRLHRDGFAYPDNKSGNSHTSATADEQDENEQAENEQPDHEPTRGPQVMAPLSGAR